MVFHVTNYMRETNVWMIRKMRWILWGAISSIPIYRLTYWDYLGRRVAWRDHLGFWGTEDEKKAKAEELRADWGYKPRYEPRYDFSLKVRKYENQTDLERVRDTPRLSPKGNQLEKEGKFDSVKLRTLQQIFMEHNRAPGSFNYDYNQNFYSHYADIDQEAYLVVGPGGDPHYAHQSYNSGRIQDPTSKPY